MAFLCFRSPGHSQNSPKFSSSRPVCVSFLNVLNCGKVMLCCCVCCLSLLLLELLPVAAGHTSSNGGHFFCLQNGFPHICSLVCLVLFASNSELVKLHPGSVDCWKNPLMPHITIHPPPKAAGLTVLTLSLHSQPSDRFEV